jgi:hypothetical protein
VQLRVVLGSLCLATTASAQVAPEVTDVDDEAQSSVSPSPPLADTIETTSWSDDLIGAPGLRPIRGNRAEALVSAGTLGTRIGHARVTGRRGALGVELGGSFLDSDGYAPIAAQDRGAVDDAASRAQRSIGARIEHERGASHLRAYASTSDDYLASGTAFQDSRVDAESYGGRWQLSRERLHVDLELFGDRVHEIDRRAVIEDDRSAAAPGSTFSVPLASQGARVGFVPRRFRALRLDHELSFGGGVVLASGEQGEQLPTLNQSHMGTTVPTRRLLHGDHRFLNAYIEDTIRFIRTLDVSGGLIIERWRYLGGDGTIAYGLDSPMDVHSPDVSALLLSPSFGAVQRLDDRFAVRVRTSRNLRAPTLGQLYRNEWVGDRVTLANPGLRPETVWTTQAGPELTAGTFVARAAMFYSSIDQSIAIVESQRTNVGSSRLVGVDTEAAWRPSRAWLATVAYTFSASRITESGAYSHLEGNELALSPRHLGRAQLTFDAGRSASLTGGVRLVGASFEDDRNTRRLGGYAIVDTLAAHKLARGLSGFVGVENLFDRRYALARTGADVLGAPRTFHVGLRVDSDRF